MPCDLKSVFQDSRGTTSICTGLSRSIEKVAATSFGVTRCGPSNSTIRVTVPCLLKQSGGQISHVSRCYHWRGLIERLEKTWNNALRRAPKLRPNCCSP